MLIMRVPCACASEHVHPLMCHVHPLSGDGMLITRHARRSVGCIATVALLTFIAEQAEPGERGALLGGVETLQVCMQACVACACLCMAMHPFAGACARARASSHAHMHARACVQELCEALGHSGYGRLFAYAISERSPSYVPAGTPFLAASALMVSALTVLHKALP